MESVVMEAPEYDMGFNPEEKHATLKTWYQDSALALHESHQKMRRDHDYYDGKQLTQEEHDALVRRGQPPIVINLVRRKIDFLLGLEAQQRTDPKAFGRTPMDGDSAEVATDTLRYIADRTKYHSKRARAWKDLLVVGIGGLEVRYKKNKRPVAPMLAQLGYAEGNPDIDVKVVRWDRMWWDSHSCDPDFGDARYRGVVLWMDLEDAKTRYPDRAESLEFAVSEDGGIDGFSETYDDKPRYNAWIDRDRKRVKVVQCYWKQGDEVFWAEFTGTEILDGGPSPWINDDGEPCDPYVWRSAYVDADNNRSGVIRDMIDPQDEVNKRRSKSLHLLTVNQIVMDHGAVEDVEKTRREANRPDGVIIKNPGAEFGIESGADLAQGQMALLQHATAELEKMGPNESLQGTGSDSQSGRAIQAKQQGGVIELGPLLDHLRSMDHETYRAMWSRAKEGWTAPEFIRITDNDDAPKFIGLNEPMIDPITGQPVGTQNSVGQINVDIIIEDSPDVVAIEQEVWGEMVQLFPLFTSMPPPLVKIAIEMSPLPPTRKRKLVEMLDQMAGGQGGPEGAPPDPQAQAMAQAQGQMQIEGMTTQHQTQMRTMEAGAVQSEAKAKEAVMKAAKAERELIEPRQVA